MSKKYSPGTHPNSKKNLNGRGTSESAKKAWETKRAKYGPRGTLKPKKGRYKTKAGYVYLSMPDHPMADKRGYVREHVFVMCQSIGRPLKNGEVVHHKNEIKDDNRIENLELLTTAEHTKHHHKGLVKPNSIKNLRKMTSEWQRSIWESGVKDHLRSKPKTCDYCGNHFFAGNRNPKAKHVFCDRKCFHLFRKKNAKGKNQAPSDSV